jgi:hypothetical protein
MKNIITLLGFIAGLSPAFAQTTPPQAGKANVTGIVTNEKEELLIGASVFWKDNKKGTVTDAEGRFSLPAREAEATLVVNYVGYTSAEVQILPGEDNIWVERCKAKALIPTSRPSAPATWRASRAKSSAKPLVATSPKVSRPTARLT